MYRDIQDKTVGTLSQHIGNQLQSLEGLERHMQGIRRYLDQVVAGELPLNNPILYQLQDIFNLLPNLNLEDFAQAFAVKMNDQMLVIYLASISRSVIALHNLISNKITNREAEKQESKKDEAKKDAGKKDKEKDQTKKDEESSSKSKKDAPKKDK